jgi:hypothetical protein
MSENRVYTKKTRNPAQVAIESSSFNQLAKAFITKKRGKYENYSRIGKRA